MSFSAVRSFFRTQMNGLKFKEWTDGFNFENIPSTTLHNAYHISSDSGQRRGIYNASDQSFEVNVTIRVFKKGYRNPAQAIDDCMSSIDAITTDILDSGTRLGEVIKNIYLDQYQILPLANSNDNSAILELTFVCLIIICV